MTPDPLGFADGPNLYAYVSNNPLIYVDPYGLLRQAANENERGTEIGDRNSFERSVSFLRGFLDDTTWGATNYCFGEYKFTSATSYRDGVNSSLVVGLAYGGTEAKLGGRLIKSTVQNPKVTKACQPVIGFLRDQAIKIGRVSKGLRERVSKFLNGSSTRKAAARTETATESVLKNGKLAQTSKAGNLHEICLYDGAKSSSNDALNLAEKFLGKGYKEVTPKSGRDLSSDGKRVFRMGENDILGKHAGGPHVNFEILSPHPNKPGKMSVKEKIHLFLSD